MMRAIAITSTVMLPFAANVRAETYADAAELALQYAESHCARPLAAQAANVDRPATAFAGVMDAMKKSSAKQPWTEAWPPSEPTVKAMAWMTSTIGLSYDSDRIADFAARKHLQFLPDDVKAAALDLPTSADLYRCLQPSETEIAAVPASVLPPLALETWKKLDCTARVAPRLSEVTLADSPADEKKSQFQAIAAEQTACEGGK